MNWGKNCTRAEICRNFKIPTFFPVFTGNLREKRNFLKFLQISALVPFLPQAIIELLPQGTLRVRNVRVWEVWETFGNCHLFP